MSAAEGLKADDVSAEVASLPRGTVMGARQVLRRACEGYVHPNDVGDKLATLMGNLGWIVEVSGPSGQEVMVTKRGVEALKALEARLRP